MHEISSWEIYSILNSLVVQTVKLREVWGEGAWNVCFLHIAWVIISIVPWWLSGTVLIIHLPSHWLPAHPRERDLIIIQSTVVSPIRHPAKILFLLHFGGLVYLQLWSLLSQITRLMRLDNGVYLQTHRWLLIQECTCWVEHFFSCTIVTKSWIEPRPLYLLLI